MTLTIANGFQSSVTEDNYTLDVHMLRQPGTHLFIASNKWDAIVIKSLDGIERHNVVSIPLACDNIKLDMDIDFDDRTMLILCALFPGRAGRIRNCYLLKGDLHEVLGDCLA